MKKKLKIPKNSKYKGVVFRIQRETLESTLKRSRIVSHDDDDDYDSSEWWTDECGLVE